MTIFRSPFADIEIPIRDTYSHAILKGKEESATKAGNKAAFIDGANGEILTFKQLQLDILSLSASFTVNKHFQKSQVLAIYAPNHIQYATVIYAAVRSGLTVTTANPSYTASEFAYQLKDSGALYIFTHESVLKDAITAAEESRISTKNIYVFGSTSVQGFESVGDLIAKGRNLQTSPVKYSSQELLNNPAYLCYSSGTTGRSKGVISTHMNIVSNVMQHMVFEDASLDTDKHIAVLPFYHIYGLTLFLHTALYRNETIIVMAKFDLVQFLELVQKYKVTHANIVPPIAIGLAKHPIVSKYDLSSLKHVLSGAAPLGEDISVEFTKRLNIPIKQAYGMTETSPLALYTPRQEIVIGTVGVLAPNMRAKIIDANGKLKGVGERGELCLQGPNVMKGYLNNEKATKETLIDGWLHTGDVAVVDKNGYYAIVDRIKELIKYKGLQVVPAELESYLLGHPAIADAAVIPRPDERAGEVPKAYVVLKQGAKVSEAEVVAYISAKVSNHKNLRGGVEFISEIPKSASGKILRRVLRDRDAASLKTKL